MKTALLSTDTTHHAWFAREIAREFPWSAIFLESKSLRAPFDTAHPFERERDAYERATWFGGGPADWRETGPVREVASMNDAGAVRALRDERPDVVVVFGTGVLKKDVLAACEKGFVNLHGGDPEQYRGLDTHLWAIYHRDFAGLVTTLHFVTAALDDGHIIAKMPVPLRRGMGLHELRAANTEVCVSLVKNALGSFAGSGRFEGRPQALQGRYYSFMPAVLKEICLNHFQRHASRL